MSKGFIPRNPYTQSIIAFFLGSETVFVLAHLTGKIELFLPLWANVVGLILLIFATIDFTLSNVKKLKKENNR